MELKFSAITDFLNEQTWFQELKSKWEELDPQSRAYLKIASVAIAALVFVYIVFSSLWSVHQLKHELSEKNELLSLIDSSNEEIRRLRESGTPPSAADQSGNWKTYFETMAGNAGVDKSSLTVSTEKSAQGTPIAKESLFDLSLKKSTIRQVVKLAYYLENGNRPVKVRNLQIDTNADPSGYLDATISVSAFSTNEKGGR